MTKPQPLFNPLSKVNLRNYGSINIPEVIHKELSKKEILEIDMQFLGDIILAQAKSLSLRVDHELIKTISVWLNDSDWMKKMQGQDSEKPEWAKYKQQSRLWTKQQKYLAKERLKLYWQKIRVNRQYRDEISKLLQTTDRNSNSKNKHCFNPVIDTSFLSDIVSRFSPIEKHRAETVFEFNQACKSSISNLLPWQIIIAFELSKNGHTALNELKIFVPRDKKLDKISKFIHLLQMENDGAVKLKQVEHAGKIQIIKKNGNVTSTVKIKDKSGQCYDFDWNFLNDRQQEKIIADVMRRKILCWSVEQE